MDRDVQAKAKGTHVLHAGVLGATAEKADGNPAEFDFFW